jgi:hypothetical protein
VAKFFKVLVFLKRNPAMTVAEFRDKYETWHAPWGAPQMANASRYVRRYFDFVGAPHADVTELDFDVVMEMWFETEADARKSAEGIAFAKLPASTYPREQAMFEGSKIRVAMVTEECDSVVGRSPSEGWP